MNDESTAGKKMSLNDDEVILTREESKRLVVDDFTRDDSIDFGALILSLWKGKLTIVICTIIFSIFGVFFALSQPNIYRSEVLLTPISDEQQGALAALAGQFGGLASFAGLDLSGGGSDKSDIALEVVVSREFITNFIIKHNILVPLMATKGWSYENKQLLYNSAIYDIKNNKWVRDVSPPRQEKPSMIEAYDAFMKIFIVVPRTENSMISFTLEHHSPELAKIWLDKLVEDINFRMKTRDQSDSSRSIEYLKEQVKETDIAEVRSVLYQLIEEQTKTLMFTEIREEYVFETIDPAIVTEMKVKPNRPALAIASFLTGGILGCFIVLVRKTYFNNVKN